MREPEASGTFDALIIGAGFGGLGAALSLSERGARVCLCESPSTTDKTQDDLSAGRDEC
jgi:glycine/D-amino acid oxidase-like deaminating enzyme